ncbi:MAG: energy transducer TonB [Bacteroidia bacterium]
MLFGLELSAQESKSKADTSIKFDHKPPANNIEESDCYDCGNTDEAPQFIGNNGDFHAYIKENIKFPIASNCIEGSVYIQIIVDTHGYVRDPLIRKSICKAFDEEALRLISIMPKWIPATQNGKVVNMKVLVPIPFKSEFYKD